MYRLIVETTREEDLTAQNIFDELNFDYYTDTEYIYIFESEEIEDLENIYSYLKNLNINQGFNFNLDLQEVF